MHVVSEDLLSTFCQLFHLSLCILNGQWKKQFSTVADWNNIDCVITQTHDELFKLSAEILVFIKASKLGRVFLWKHSTEYLGQRARYEFLKIWSVKSSLHTRPSLSNIRQCLSNTWPSFWGLRRSRSSGVKSLKTLAECLNSSDTTHRVPISHRS